jgi:hypothetical protein
VQARNLVKKERWAEGNIESLPALKAEMLSRKVDVGNWWRLAQQTQPNVQRKGEETLGQSDLV